MFQGLEDALSLPETETDPEGELLSKAKLAAKTLCMNVMILFSCAPPSPLPLSFLPHLPACLPYTTRDDGKLAFLFAGKGVRVVTSRSQSHRWGLAGKISRAIRGSLIRLYTVNPLPDVSPLRKKIYLPYMKPKPSPAFGGLPVSVLLIKETLEARSANRQAKKEKNIYDKLPRELIE